VSSRVRKTLSYHQATATRALRQLPNELCMIARRPISYGKRAECYQHMFVSASRGYRAKAYEGAIVMFSAQGRGEWHRKRWSSIAQRGVSVYEVPANHLDIVWPPNSTMLAQHFDSALARLSDAQPAHPANMSLCQTVL
jgi:thioesterase domain-containing protein